MEEERQKILEKSRREMSDSLPKLAVYIGIAVLIWLFGALIFVPLAAPYVFAGISLGTLISAIVLVALILILLYIFRELVDVADAAAGFATVSAAGAKATTEQVGQYRLAFRALLYVVVAVLIYLFLQPFLATIHPAVAGIVLVVLVIWALWELFRAGSGLSGIIEQWASGFSQRMEERAEKEAEEREMEAAEREMGK